MAKIIIAAGPVIVENNKVLLDKDNKEDFWKFCGGIVKEKESLIDTAKRRSKEELSINIDILDGNPFIMYTIKENPDGKIDIILVHFLAKRIGEIKSGKDIREWKWFDINRLPENVGPNIIPALKHFESVK